MTVQKQGNVCNVDAESQGLQVEMGDIVGGRLESGRLPDLILP